MNVMTLPELLISNAVNFPEHGIGYVCPDRTIQFETYPELLVHARSILGGLQKAGIRRGDNIILSLDGSSEIIPALWACFLGGIVPALLQPPVSFSSYNPAAEKAEKVFRQLNSPGIVVSRRHMDNWRTSQIPQERLIDYSSLSDDLPFIEADNLSSKDLALIQFSSGSTGDPKGVMLTHANILSNIEDIIKGIRLGSEDVSVNWMPLYHDMGLFGFHITPVCTGTTQYFVEPVDFVKDPFLWLDMIHDKRGTITGCPNFGQMLVTRHLSRKPGKEWDFTSLRIIFNGAEPISVPIMNDFLHRLAPFRLDPNAMFPAYGMAECTLAVTFPPMGTGASVISFDRKKLLIEGKAFQVDHDIKDAIQLVNLGRSLDHCAIRITDDEGDQVPEATVGHLLVRGGNVTQGYYGNPELSSESYSGEWFRTGDLGFILKGDFFITGRAKDIIFINGVNYYAHDLETLAIRIPEVVFGKIVMAGYFDETEGKDKIIVFLVGSANEETNVLFRRIKDHFTKMIGLAIDTYIPVRSADIPHTSSGKIQRYKMVNRFLKGEFSTVVKLGN
jgi:acyl-CoA synthetase (AMP-forming)/AMP-acid ligase II